MKEHNEPLMKPGKIYSFIEWDDEPVIVKCVGRDYTYDKWYYLIHQLVPMGSTYWIEHDTVQDHYRELKRI